VLDSNANDFVGIWLNSIPNVTNVKTKILMSILKMARIKT
jgi:hypothetical protein